MSTHRAALTLARCSVAAHYASLRVLATSALRASDGQRPGRVCIFTFRTALALRRRGVPCLRTSCARHFSPSGLHLFASVCSAKNARNDVHAVISDLSLVLPILCQCSAFCDPAGLKAMALLPAQYFLPKRARRNRETGAWRRESSILLAFARPPRSSLRRKRPVPFGTKIPACPIFCA